MGKGEWGFLTPEILFRRTWWDRGRRNPSACFAEFLREIDVRPPEVWRRQSPALSSLMLSRCPKPATRMAKPPQAPPSPAGAEPALDSGPRRSLRMSGLRRNCSGYLVPFPLSQSSSPTFPPPPQLISPLDLVNQENASLCSLGSTLI